MAALAQRPGTENSPSLPPGPGHFLEELMAAEPQDIGGEGWMAATDVSVRNNSLVFHEQTASFLAGYALRSVNAPNLSSQQHQAHSPGNEENAHIDGGAGDRLPDNRGTKLLHGHYKRGITSKTALRFLHIPVDMHRQLGLDEIYSIQASGRRGNVATVHLVSGSIRAAVVMLRTTSKGQHHRRLSTGWREFCAQAGVEIGDEVVFERAGACHELAVRVVKAGLLKIKCGR